jgi:hypothetical protein
MIMEQAASTLEPGPRGVDVPTPDEFLEAGLGYVSRREGAPLDQVAQVCLEGSVAIAPEGDKQFGPGLACEGSKIINVRFGQGNRRCGFAAGMEDFVADAGHEDGNSASPIVEFGQRALVERDAAFR